MNNTERKFIAMARDYLNLAYNKDRYSSERDIYLYLVSDILKTVLEDEQTESEDEECTSKTST